MIEMTELVELIRVNPDKTSRELSVICGQSLPELRQMIRKLTEQYKVHFDKSQGDYNRYRVSYLDTTTTRGQLVSRKWTSELEL